MCFFPPLYYFLSSPHLFLLIFFLSNFPLHLVTECRQTAALAHDVLPGLQATEVPDSLQEQGRSKAWHRSAGSWRARRHLGDHVTQKEQILLSSRQECGINEPKRVRPTAESTLHVDSADATQLQTNITIQNCGIGATRAPNSLLFLRES